jgi:hypothetical protein
MIQLTAENMLPDTGILIKLKAHAPDLAEAAFARAEKIGTNRRAWEKANLRVTAATEEFSVLAQEGLSGDFARTGDNMRLGILAVMRDHNLTAESLGLNAAEQESLVLLRTSYMNPLEKFDY